MAPTYEIDNFQFFNADNMEIMKQYPDKYFDLAIVDPPYGIGLKRLTGNNTLSGAQTRMGKLYRKRTDYDKKPNNEYFIELLRVSENVIVWGGNYFTDILPVSREWICWNKDKYSLMHSDFELAYTSFDGICKNIKIQHHGFLIKDKEVIHPNQKPVMLYEWILSKYAKPNDKIIDTHLGSNSIGIAIDKANVLDKKNLSFVGIELDEDYFNAGIERFKNYKRQLNLF